MTPGRTGQVIGGRYELASLLGQGGMGAVWRARDRQVNRDVAIKLVLGGGGAERGARLRREAELAARLDHAGIVRVHDAGEEGGHPWIAFELVDGPSPLRDAWRRLDLAGRVSLVREAADALGHAHARGIVHRDVKAENVLVDAAGRARVADFGLATSAEVERLTHTGAALGTPVAMAPEQIGGGAVGVPADVWALGVLLYEALTGVLPFTGESVPELVGKILAASPTPPRRLAPDVPRHLEAVCLRALSRSPEARYADGAAMARAIESGESGSDPRSRRLALLGLALVLLLVTAIGAVVVTRARTATAAEEGAPTVPAPVEPLRPDTSAPPPPTTRAKVAPPPPWFERLPAASRPPLPLPAALEYSGTPGRYAVRRDRTVELVWVPPPEGGTFHVPGYVPRNPELTVVPSRDEVMSAGVFMGRTEVTAEQYRRFARDTGRPLPPAASMRDLPAQAITWTDAGAFCAWADVRLPTEAEWFLAALGTDGRPFPWGDEGRVPMDGRGHLMAVGQVEQNPDGASPFGCLEMAGNVREWVEAPTHDRGARMTLGNAFSGGLASPFTRRVSDLEAKPSDAVGFRVACSPGP